MLNIIEYFGIAVVIVLAIVGLVYQARVFFNKEKRDVDKSLYSEFSTNLEFMKNKLSLQEDEIKDLKDKMRSLEEANKCLREELAYQTSRAHHYQALFVSRCPYEKMGVNGYCEYFHRYDIDEIKAEILNNTMADMDNMERELSKV